MSVSRDSQKDLYMMYDLIHDINESYASRGRNRKISVENVNKDCVSDMAPCYIVRYRGVPLGSPFHSAYEVRKFLTNKCLYNDDLGLDMNTIDSILYSQSKSKKGDRR